MAAMAEIEPRVETSSPLPAVPSRRIVEVKEALAGGERRFDLECWHRDRELVVARWVAPAENPWGVAPGTYSWGVWWRTRSYGAYRFHTPYGALRRYRLDVIERVRIGQAEVRYTDLLLDAVMRPSGGVQLEDEDEVMDAILNGRLSPAQQRRIDWTQALFERRGAQVRARIDAAIARAVAEVGTLGG